LIKRTKGIIKRHTLTQYLQDIVDL